MSDLHACSFLPEQSTLSNSVSVKKQYGYGGKQKSLLGIDTGPLAHSMVITLTELS
jgi:hypothetical protein